jgi:hypothetical protein
VGVLLRALPRHAKEDTDPCQQGQEQERLVRRMIPDTARAVGGKPCASRRSATATQLRHTFASTLLSRNAPPPLRIPGGQADDVAPGLGPVSTPRPRHGAEPARGTRACATSPRPHAVDDSSCPSGLAGASGGDGVLPRATGDLRPIRCRASPGSSSRGPTRSGGAARPLDPELVRRPAPSRIARGRGTIG